MQNKATMSYKLKEVDRHPEGKWTLYTVDSTHKDSMLETSPSDGDRLDVTRRDARKHARVQKKAKVSQVSEQTGDVSF